MNLKNIHIGKCLKEMSEGLQIPIERICRFLNCNEEEVEQMYVSASIDTEILLRWSKLLEYDFFRLYVGHLVLYAPNTRNTVRQKKSRQEVQMPIFRKNIYTKEIKDFIIEKFKSGKMTAAEITNTYNIPKTTINKWIKKSL